jgi:hypothetical protein
MANFVTFPLLTLNPAVDLETATGFVVPYNWGE